MQWIELDDFRPGIVMNLGLFRPGGFPTSAFDPTTYGAYGPGAKGMASMLDTYDCIATPQGALGPGPAHGGRIGRDSFLQGVKTWSVFACVTGPMFAGFGSSQPMFNVDFRNDFSYFYNQIFFGFVSQYGTPKVRIDQIVGLTTTGGGLQGDIVDYTQALNHVGKMATWKSLTATGPGAPPNTPIMFAPIMLNPTTPTAAGSPVIVTGWVNAYPAGGASFLDCYPDPTNLASTLPVALNNAGKMGSGVWGWPIAHQNRIVVLRFQNFQQGGTLAEGQFQSNEYLAISQPNTWVVEPTGSLMTYTADSPVGFGAWASVTSSDLLLIKHTGGALLIQGDLNYPVVRKLPGVVGTQGTVCLPAIGPNGVAYGVNRDGVYLWNGGDGSELLSPQLSPDFWLSGDSDEVAMFKGQFAWWGQWLLTPNSFLYDTTLQSWWRLGAPGIYRPSGGGALPQAGDVDQTPYVWQVDPMGTYAFGVVPRFVDTNNAGSAHWLAHYYDRSRGATSYSWRSQPLFADTKKVVRVREVILVAQGDPTAKVTIEFFGDMPVSLVPGPGQGATATEAKVGEVVFILDDRSNIGVPIVMRKTLAARGMANIRMRIKAEGRAESGAVNAAPLIYKVSIGWDAEHEARGG